MLKNIRKNLGKILADKEDVLNKEDTDYIVIGIPLTGILYGKSYAKHLELDYQQLIKKLSMGMEPQLKAMFCFSSIT